MMNILALTVCYCALHRQEETLMDYIIYIYCIYNYKSHKRDFIKTFAYTSGAKRCNLCLAEKLAILQADQRTLLNKRSEFVSKCRHRNKFKLKKA